MLQWMCIHLQHEMFKGVCLGVCVSLVRSEVRNQRKSVRSPSCCVHTMQYMVCYNVLYPGFVLHSMLSRRAAGTLFPGRYLGLTAWQLGSTFSRFHLIMNLLDDAAALCR